MTPMASLSAAAAERCPSAARAPTVPRVLRTSRRFIPAYACPMDGSLRDRDVGRGAHGAQRTIQVSRDGSIDSRSDPPRSAVAAAEVRAYVIGRWAGLPARLAVRLRPTHPNGAN